MSRPLAMTVAGPLPANQLGLTLVHEHLHMDATPLLAIHGYATSAAGPFDVRAATEARWNPGSHPDNYRFVEDDVVIGELAPFKAAGGQTIVELTPPALGRDPEALLRIGRQAGINVVMGAGHYLQPTHGLIVAAQTEDELTEALVREASQGAGETGLRPGIIGEIGTSNPVHREEHRVLRAAARAARVSGLAVSVHLHPWGTTGREVIDTLLGEGISPGRIILGHVSTAHDNAAYIGALLDRGVFVAFDLFGFDHSLIGLGRWPPSDADVVATVTRLVRQGHAGRVLISHDIGVRTRLRAHGGWGYAHIFDHVVPLLLEQGLDESELDTILVRNPSTLLTIDLP